MDSRKLVYKTLEFDGPQRIPRHIRILPWAQSRYPDELSEIQSRFPADVVHAVGFLKEQPRISGDPYVIGTFVDEWGCEFVNRQNGVYGEVKNPIMKSLDNVKIVREPVELLSVDIDAVNTFCQNTDKFVFSGGFVRPFERIQFLRGTENVMMDLALYPTETEHLLNIIHQFNLKLLRVWAKTDVDALLVFDDWGAQRSLLISPDMWRKFLKPLYVDYVQIAHDVGKKIFVHSDGYIIDLFNDIIEIGVDAINSQVFCMGLDQLRQYAGKITFWGELDRQYLLPYGTTEEIVDAVVDTYKHLHRNGGLIAQVEFGPGAKPQNVLTALEIFDTISEGVIH